MDARDKYEYLPNRYIEKGDRFRASLGPYWERDGRRHNMATKGVFTFNRFVIDDTGNEIIEAKTLLGTDVTLIIKKVNSGDENMVYRPYKLTKVKK